MTITIQQFGFADDEIPYTPVDIDNMNEQAADVLRSLDDLRDIRNDLDLVGYDFVRFAQGPWKRKRIDIRATEDGLVVNSDIGSPLTIEMSSSN